MPTAVRSLLAALVATAAVVGGGVVLTDPPPEEPVAAPPPEAPAITLDDLDTTTIAANRAGFCAGVAEEEVVAALGAEPTGQTSYVNGERADLAPDTSDVAHEFGCTWTAADGGTARGWVFAPPVTPDRARALARDALGTRRCERLPTAATFGTTSAATRCTVRRTREVAYRGLFGDAWLTCSLSGPAGAPAADLEARASRWCAAVVLASSTESATG